MALHIAGNMVVEKKRKICGRQAALIAKLDM